MPELKPDAWELGFRAGTEGRNPPTPEGLDDAEFQLGVTEGNAARPAMFEMLKELTPEERATLQDPDFITEDEADLIVSDRRAGEPCIPLDEVLAEIGYIPRSQRVRE